MYVYACTYNPSLLPLTAHNNDQTTYEVQYQGVDTPNDVNDTFYEAVTVSARMELSYDTSGLMPYSAYNVSVRATNQYGVGDFSEEVTVRTEEGGEYVLHQNANATWYNIQCASLHLLCLQHIVCSLCHSYSSICSPRCYTAWQYTHLPGNLLVHALFQ